MKNFFLDLKLRNKLLLGFSLIAIIILVVGIRDYNILSIFKENQDEFIDNYKSLSEFSEAKYYLRYELQLANRLMLTSEIKEIEMMWDEHIQNIEKINSFINSIKSFTSQIDDFKYHSAKRKILSSLLEIEEDYKKIIIPSFEKNYSAKREMADRQIITKIDEVKIPKVQDTTITDSPEQSDLLDISPIFGRTKISENVEADSLSADEPGVFFGMKEKSENKVEFEKGDTKKKTIEELNEYINATGNKIIKKIEVITINADSYVNEVQEFSNQEAKYNLGGSVLFVFVGLLITFAIILFLARIISQPINKLQNLINKLAIGELPEAVEVKSKDEIGEMTIGINFLMEGLKRIAFFAIEMRKGNFTSSFTPLSGNDVLGNSLLTMRKNFQESKDEEHKRKIEDEQRNWATQGLAQFGEILRHHTDDIEELANNIIKNIVKYINANQGGLFLYKDEDPGDLHLELIAAYAYNRKKFLERKIRLGEGLVGMCAIERYTVFLTEVPDEYIEIESGLGLTNPKCLLIVPLKMENEILGVLELASLNRFEKHEITLIEKISESIASTLATLKINARTALLLEQSQKQAQEMHEQEEEMRQNIEEMQATQEEATRRERELRNRLNQMTSEFDYLKQKNIQQQNRIERLENLLKEQNIEL